jgi:prepilin-type N-terminal cleavage/methylation domain-containing protein
MSSERRKINRGFTLTEVMVAVAITIIVALGTLCYQYQGVKHSKVAQAQLAATRLGQLVLEDWKSTGGDPAYDPATLNLGFGAPSAGEPGDYFITLDNQTFFVLLERSLIEEDAVAGVQLWQIRVTVQWSRNYGRGAVSAGDPRIILTTYVRRDA